MNLPKSAGPKTNRRELLLVALVAGVILVLLFHRSFEPDQTLFSNDSPLGVLMAYNDVSATLFTGHWDPFNWIGSRQPSALPNLSYTLYLIWGAIIQSKFLVPVALFVLALSAWTLLKQLGLGRAACFLGAIAAMLNTDPFSYACWGLPTLTMCMAATFFSLAAVARWTGPGSWIRAILAGFALGIGIMEGFDNGAIFSLYVAAFTLFQGWIHESGAGQRLIKGALRTAVVAIAAAIMAAHGLSTLVETQIQGIAGMQQDTKTKEQRWDEATTWSLPKIETLRVLIPGLMGYRMDTPDGGLYWGGVGQTPGVPQARHSGAGVYVGVLVVLLGAFALVQAGRKAQSPFSERERKIIWFWLGAAIVSLLLAFGRHAPLYQFFYMLPYFSTIRNPIKFMHPFTIAMVILFAYGVEALARRYLTKDAIKSSSVLSHVQTWWKTVSGFDRRWAIGSGIAVAASALAWMLYASSHRELEGYMQSISSDQLFPASLIPAAAQFSIHEVGWFVLFLAVAAGAVVLIVSGAFSKERANTGVILLALILFADFAHANAPWIIYENYKEKYASNPVIDFLREKPYDSRTAARVTPFQGPYLTGGEASGLFAQVVDREWLQHHYQYYRLQSLDIVQMPRIPELDLSYMRALSPKTNDLSPIGRLWQLTSTRYILGMKGFLNAVNEQVDPTNHSFRVQAAFDFAPRAGANQGQPKIEDITTVMRPEGNFAIFEYGASLPRVKLFDHWEVSTNDPAILHRLADPAFDPRGLLLVSGSAITSNPGLSTNAGSAEITFYKPKHVHVKVEAAASSILLLNDKYDPNWKVTIDGKAAQLLRCNYIMRGVPVPSGKHEVAFDFDPPHGTLFVSLSAVAVGLVLCCFLAFGPRPLAPVESVPPSAPAAPKAPVQGTSNQKAKAKA